MNKASVTGSARLGGWVAGLLRALFLATDEGDKGAAVIGLLRKLFAIAIALPLLLLFNALSGHVYVEAPPLGQLNLIPVGLASALALWIAYLFGPRTGVLVSLSLLLSPLVGEMANQLLANSGLVLRYGLVSPAAVVALAVTAWMVGLARERYLNAGLRERMTFKIGDPHLKHSRMRLWQIALLVALATGLTLKGEGQQWQWSPLGLLSIYITWLTLRYNYKQMSNTVLVVFTVLMLLEIRIPLDEAGSTLDLGGFHVYEVIFLVLLPLAVPMFELSSLARMRAFLFSLLFAAWGSSLIFAPGAYGLIPDLSLLWKLERSGAALLSLLVTALLYELGARLVWLTRRP